MRYRLQAAGAFVGMLVAVLASEGSAEAQNIRALARAHATDSPGVPLQLTGSPGDYSPKSVDELAEASDLILLGRLSRIQSYLGPNEDRILTDYRLQAQQVVAGNLPRITSKIPGNVPPLILTVYGGELTIEGVLVRATDPNRADIDEGKLYLLFLTHSRRGDPGYYESCYGGIFEVSQNRLKPILKHGETIFKDTAGSSLEDVLARIKRHKLP